MAVQEKIRLAYFKGCIVDSISKELDISTKSLAKHLNIELIEFKEFSCCGSRSLPDYDAKINLLINARNLAIAEERKLDIITTCSTCTNSLRQVALELNNNLELRKEANKKLKSFGLEYKGKVKVKHLLDVLKEVDFSKISKKLVYSLNNLKVAPFYGCHSLRPREISTFPNATLLDELITSLGGSPVNYIGKTKCCGFHTLAINQSNSVKIAGINIKEAVDKNADCFVVLCPFCHIVLDGYQGEVSSSIKTKMNKPVFHLPQLLGLCLGIKPAELGLDLNMVSCKKIVERIVKK